MTGRFAEWQRDYAAHGIATFPVEFIPDGEGNFRKKPLIGNYGHIGLRASAKFAERFADAQAIGFTPGVRSKITVCDIDEPGDAPLQRALGRHGVTPIIVRNTATGKHHCIYRFNGERRIVRPEPGVKVDILGHQEGKGNFVVAAPSFRPGGQYQFLRGGLDDIRRLPVMRNVPPNALIKSLPIPRIPDNSVPPDETKIAPAGVRDVSLWRACMRALGGHRVHTYAELLAYARKTNAEKCRPPQPDDDVMHAADSAWGFHQRGENWFGRPGLHFFSEEALPLIDHDIDLFRLLSFIKATQRPDNTFMLTNSMCERWGWSRQRFAAARAKAIAIGEICCVRPARQHLPALYCRASRISGCQQA